VLPLLIEYDEDESPDAPRSKLSFGYSFLEKFIQLSVRVPMQSDPEAILAFLDSLTPGLGKPTQSTSRQAGAPEPKETKPVVPDSAPVRVDYNRIETKGESERIRRVVLMVSGVFHNNPRRLKLFLNSYRLSLYLASGQGLLDIRHDNREAAVTPEQLGKFIALIMRLPALLDVLAQDNKALAEYEVRATDEGNSPGLPGWINKSGIPKLLKYGVVNVPDQPFDLQRYSLARFPVDKMLSAVPLAPTPKREPTASTVVQNPKAPDNREASSAAATDASAFTDPTTSSEQSYPE
jgi:hypothetical protein